MKNKKNLLKIAFMTSVSICSINANAQWAVMDAALQKNGVFTKSMAELLGALNTSINGTTKILGEQGKRMEEFQVDTDQRLRQALIEQKMYEDTLNAAPTVQRCIELTNSRVTSSVRMNNGTFRFGGSSGGGGFKFNKYTQKARYEENKNTATGLALTLQSAKDLGNDTGVMAQALGLSNVGSDLEGTATNPWGIFHNVMGKKSGALYNNFSISDGNALRAGAAYIANATISNAPPTLTPEEIKKNPAYLSMYNNLTIKLNAAYYTLETIAKRREANGLSGEMAKYWDKNSSKYSDLFPDQVKPTNAISEYEMLKFEVYKEHEMPEDDQYATTEKKLDSLRKNVALGNKISLLKLEEQEKTNLLLSHLLVNQVAPITATVVREEAIKTKNIK